MITHIRIDGFKSFREFSLDVPPTLLLLGPNGAGKSNLFDALRLVAGTADWGFEATVRGDRRLSLANLFHRDSEKSRSQVLTIAIGALVASQEGPLPICLQLRVGRTPDGQVAVLAKSAVWVSGPEDPGWMGQEGLDDEAQLAVMRARAAFLERTGTDHVSFRGPLGTPWGLDTLKTAGEAGNEEGALEAGDELRALAARECASWQPFVLDPDALRRPTAALATGRLSPDGSNLAAVLHRVQDQAPKSWLRLVADVAALVDGVLDIRPLYDERREEYDFEVEFSNTGWVSPPALSDGTLRMIALLAAAADPFWPGGMCVEEIENGMHPEHVADLFRRLRRGAGVQAGSVPAYRQLVATTHSPALLAALRSELTGSLVFLEQADRVDPQVPAVSRTTVARPLREFDPDRAPGETVSPAHVERMLRKLGRGLAS
ncbi:AAA family ATPase [Streptomyces lavendulae]|uniref:AAA family ATPase n=1 Tax=Streptomyces lavendulae TaxID=1914 RepID=UPI0036EC4F03